MWELRDEASGGVNRVPKGSRLLRSPNSERCKGSAQFASQEELMLDVHGLRKEDVCFEMRLVKRMDRDTGFRGMGLNPPTGVVGSSHDVDKVSRSWLRLNTGICDDRRTSKRVQAERIELSGVAVKTMPAIRFTSRHRSTEDVEVLVTRNVTYATDPEVLREEQGKQR